jgi:hypothetical protein
VAAGHEPCLWEELCEADAFGEAAEGSWHELVGAGEGRRIAMPSAEDHDGFATSEIGREMGTGFEIREWRVAVFQRGEKGE